MFSIIIPLYNKELNIKSTIDSILAQSFTNFEIVIVNDGSTDQSVKVVEKIQDRRIRLLHQKNQGVSSARNKGIKEAKYEWICFLDGDDLWMGNHLKEYYQAIESNNRLNWLISGYTVGSQERQKDEVYNELGVLANIFDCILKGLKVHTSSVCVRKKLFTTNPDLLFRVGMNNSEDREVWYKLCCIDQSPYYINKSLSFYDSHVEGSLTKNSKGVSNDHFLTMQDRLEEFGYYTKLCDGEKSKLQTIIYRFNQKAIKNKYIQGAFKLEYKKYLSSYCFFIYKSTLKIPKFFKKVIAKVC